MQRTAIVVSAAWLMVVAAMPTFFLSVFATQVMDRFDVGHAEIGLLVSLIYASATVLARRSGALVDRHGSASGGGFLLLSGAVTMATLAWAPNYWMLLAASVVAGIPLAMSNPVTNVVIRNGLSGRLRRSAMGIKQAGVPLAVVIAGAVLPSLAIWIGWRGVAFGIAAVTLLTLLPWSLLSRSVPQTAAPEGERGQDQAPDTWTFRLLRRYALAMGGLAGLLNTFYVLFVVQELQWSIVEAGWVAASVGITGAVARWLWVELAARTRTLSPILTLMTLVGCMGTIAMWSSQRLEPLIWVGAVLIGASVMGWQGFVMHAVASKAPASVIGKESGLVMQQFYLGLLVTPFSIGWAIEQSGSYNFLWGSQAVLFGLAIVPVLLLRRMERTSAAGSADPGGLEEPRFVQTAPAEKR